MAEKARVKEAKEKAKVDELRNKEKLKAVKDQARAATEAEKKAAAEKRKVYPTPGRPLAFYCIVQFEDTHGRYPKTHFMRCSVQRYVHTERHPCPPQQFVALCILSTAILGIQKHIFWAVGCAGMCRWSATPTPPNSLLRCACCAQSF